MKELDYRGLRCPIPIINLSREILDLPNGEVVKLVSDDPATWPDLQAWARMTKREVTKTDEITFTIKK